MLWQLNRIGYPVYNLGPGRRVVIWTQGCSLGCSGCISPDMWDKKAGHGVEVEYLAEQIVSITGGFDGVTVSGGEPFAQPKALALFLEAIKQKTTLNTLVFSGYTFAELTAQDAFRAMHGTIDFLIDGRYERNQHDGQVLRGSKNQTTYKFSEGHFQQVPAFKNENVWSVNVDDESSLFLSGIPKAGELKAMAERLNKRGANLQFL